MKNNRKREKRHDLNVDRVIRMALLIWHGIVVAHIFACIRALSASSSFALEAIKAARAEPIQYLYCEVEMCDDITAYTLYRIDSIPPCIIVSGETWHSTFQHRTDVCNISGSITVQYDIDSIQYYTKNYWLFFKSVTVRVFLLESASE